MVPSIQTLSFAILGGIVPAILWLLFWLREDKRCPEPRGLLVVTFIAGMIAVPFVIPIETFAQDLFAGSTLFVLLSWAVIEEVMKFSAAYIAVLRNKAVNEPVDMMIYMITVALGFAACENILFLLSPIENGFVVESILTGNLRFVGATLLHTVASATIGAALAFSFFSKRITRRLSLFIGLILASVLHAFFNLSILRSNADNGLLLAFLGVWFGIIILILLFERVKRIQKPRPIFTKRTY
ncbi:MAG TPA: PrsW family glutamic-type intramembrane protease [Candidatus Paceibacterota bacterium]